MARPGKYETHIKPYLKQIAEWKKSGATDKQIAEKLGVAMSTWCDMKNKHPEFSEVLKHSVDLFVADLRGELARLAFKHTIQTKKVYTTTASDGTEKRHTEITEKEVDGDIAAIHLLLKNLDRDNWAENPQGLELRKQELELKKRLAEANNFDLDLRGMDT